MIMCIIKLAKEIIMTLHVQSKLQFCMVNMNLKQLSHMLDYTYV